MLGRLLSWRRYARCRELFREPLAAHWKLASVHKGGPPHTLAFRDGGELVFDDPRGFRTLWDAVLDGERDFAPATDGDVLVLHADGQPVGVRPNSSDSHCFREVYLEDVYRLDALDRPLGDVVDLGGNIGLFSLRIAPHAKRVVCVEAVEDNVEVARRNLERAGLAGKVTLLQRAAGARSGEKIPIYLSGGATTTYSTSERFAGHFGGLAGRVEVESVGLADLFERHGIERCDLLKCDVEGAEYAIFDGTPDDVLARIDWIEMEIHLGEPELPLARFEALAERLRASGFEVDHEPAHGPDGALVGALMLEARRR